jgi:hypothetical protein
VNLRTPTVIHERPPTIGAPDLLSPRNLARSAAAQARSAKVSPGLGPQSTALSNRRNAG